MHLPSSFEGEDVLVFVVKVCRGGWWFVEVAYSIDTIHVSETNVREGGAGVDGAACSRSRHLTTSARLSFSRIVVEKATVTASCGALRRVDLRRDVGVQSHRYHCSFSVEEHCCIWQLQTLSSSRYFVFTNAN